MDSIKFLNDIEVPSITIDGEPLRALTDAEIIALFEEADMTGLPIAEELSV